MNGIFGDHNFEPVQPELAVWPVCSRAAFFFANANKAEGYWSQSNSPGPIMVGSAGLEHATSCL